MDYYADEPDKKDIEVEDIQFSQKIFEAKPQYSNKKRAPIEMKYETLEKIIWLSVIEKDIRFY